MAVGGTEAIGSLARGLYCYTGDDQVVYQISMRTAYAVECQLKAVGASGAPTVTGGTFPGKPRHVFLQAPAGTVTNTSNKPVRRKMPFDAAQYNYLSNHAIGTLTANAIDGITFQIMGHTGEKRRG